MTAVSPGDARGGGGRQLLVGVLCGTLAWTPWALVWGEALGQALDFDQAARDGQALGTTLGQDPTVWAPFARPDDARVFFPGAEAGDLTDWTGLYATPQALTSVGQATRQDLVETPFEDASATAQAYQTLSAPVDRPRADLSADPLWGFTDATLNTLDAFAASAADCTWDTTFLRQPRTVHVPRYEACLIPDKDPPTRTCTATRALDATVFWEPVVVGTDPATGAPITEPRRRVEKRQDRWTWDAPDCPALLEERLLDGFCHSLVRCVQNPDAHCVAVTGGELCGDELVAPPYAGVTGQEPWERFQGIGAACMAVRVELDCTRFNVGPLDCWTDPDGVEHCPDNPGDQDGCAALDANPGCRPLSQTCAEAATGRSGVCYVDQRVYDCGTDQIIAGLARTTTLACGGSIRCLGEDCVQVATESSDAFDEAVAALQAAEWVALDTDCAGGVCTLFQGSAHTCKRAVGGLVNCCETPSGISLTAYLRLLFAVAKLDSVSMALIEAGQTGPLLGAWETLRSPVVDTWTAVQDAFSSVVNNLTGHTEAAVSEAASRGILETFRQQLLQQTAQWTAQVFGPQAANSLFVDATTGGTAFAADGSLLTAQVALNPQALVVMQWLMAAYLIYSLVVILIQLIWTCTEDEFTLGVQRELKSCHRVGSYCRKNLFGACIESRDSYCCFNSPLSRILNEQLRGQFGRDFGSARDPDCAGLALEDLTRVDWDRVDLSEWLSLLTAADLVITPTDLTPEALTEGQGNRTATRLQDLSDVQTVGGANRAAEAQAWSETLPSVPQPAESGQ